MVGIRQRRFGRTRPRRWRHAATALATFLAVVALDPCRAARAETILHLDATGTVSAHPDLLVASLHADATSPAAADAQRRVNTMVTDVVEFAKSVPGVNVATGNYNVWHTAPNPPDRAERWQASQSVMLKSADGPALLKLVGDLQQKGLAVEQLSWRLAPETARKAEEEATRKAVAGLREKADSLAKLLDLAFDSFRTISVGGPPPPVAIRAAMPAPMSMAAAPVAEAEDTPVTSSVEADVVLKPR